MCRGRGLLGPLGQVTRDPSPWHRSAEDWGSLPHAVYLYVWKPTWMKAGKKNLKFSPKMEETTCHQTTLVSPPEVEETAGHIRVIFILAVILRGSVLPITFQATLTALVQVRSHADAGAILEEGLTWLLQTAHFALVFQYRLAHWKIQGSVNSITNLASDKNLRSMKMNEKDL